eukprot:5467389-Karenia_brevis.AAC.1
MVVACAKEPEYTSAMEDPLNDMWGKQVEPIIVPKGDQGKQLFNHIYSDHVCPPRDPPPGGWIGRLW